MPRSLLWFRRDLRLHDHPALLAACEAGSDGVVPLYVLDPAWWRAAGDPQQAYLLRSLRALDAGLHGRLAVRHGNPAEVVLAVARSAGATSVHVSADFDPYGRERDDRVTRALAEAGVAFVPTGSAYAVSPGRVLNRAGAPYAVFTPYARAWADHGWRRPARRPRSVPWTDAGGGSDDLPAEPDLGGLDLPAAGEVAARRRWREFRDEGLDAYDTTRDRPDLDGTSRMSHHLAFGEVHPRTLLADLAEPAHSGWPGARALRTELAWREFFADVLFHHPASAHDYHRREFARMPYDQPGDGFAAWRSGRTGFPLVDAGMRQLRGQGWLPNRVRMVVASFLVKDLHVEWQHGARHFMAWLCDADLASNQLNWQWVAGSGTDAAPYVRVFNPVTQGTRFDPDGGYVRRWVPELAHLAGAAAHQPWAHPQGYARGYPERIVDHAAERVEALARYQAVRAR